MKAKLTAHIEHDSDGYVGWIHSIPGLVVFAKTLEGVKAELLISVKVQYAFTNQIDINRINASFANTVAFSSSEIENVGVMLEYA
jgi:hypothetical protein